MFSKVSQITGTIALVFALRMLGLFMILPIFSHYVSAMPGATALSVGWAFGAYGLTQALLQIPLGLASDRFGRKLILLLGLSVFLVGSLVAAMAHSVTTIIVGRALQGAGAIGSTLLALLADLTAEEQRTRAMASIGMTIGFSFILALFLGPILSHWFGLSGLFWLMCGFAICGMSLVWFCLPTPARAFHHLDIQTTLSQCLPLLNDPSLRVLNFSIFSLHALLTLLFMVVPNQIASIGLSHQKAALVVYLPALLSSALLLFPLVILAEKKRRMKELFLGSISLLGLCIALLWQWSNSIVHLVITLGAFFTAFNLLEACLPSWVSKVAPLRSKGSAIGLYSSCQFLGIFVGGIVGGWCLSGGNVSILFMVSVGLVSLWLLLALWLAAPQYVQTILIKTANIRASQSQQLSERLLQCPGVAEAVVDPDEKTAYLKIDRRQIDRNRLEEFVKSF